MLSGLSSRGGCSTSHVRHIIKSVMLSGLSSRGGTESKQNRLGSAARFYIPLCFLRANPSHKRHVAISSYRNLSPAFHDNNYAKSTRRVPIRQNYRHNQQYMLHTVNLYSVSRCAGLRGIFASSGVWVCIYAAGARGVYDPADNNVSAEESRFCFTSVTTRVFPR